MDLITETPLHFFEVSSRKKNSTSSQVESLGIWSLLPEIFNIQKKAAKGTAFNKQIPILLGEWGWRRRGMELDSHRFN